jgi:hypothetical protein
VLNIFAFLLNLIDQHTIWLYAACLLIILFYLRAFIIARTQRANTIFTIEREVAAHREGQAMSSIGAMLGVVIVIMGIKYYLVPSLDIETLIEPTPTMTIALPTMAPTMEPTEEPTATATPRPRPTKAVQQPTVAPTDTPLSAPANCPNANVRIMSPGKDAVISGWIDIQGTANISEFQFYKIEWAAGEIPGDWHSISNIHNSPVTNGLLDEFDTHLLPNGVYWLRLTVVDQTGNFPEPCAVRLVFEN